MTTSKDNWTNYGHAIFKREKGLEESAGQKPPLLRSTSFTSGAIKKASIQWYKMKWQFTGSANNLWGEEIQGYAVFKPKVPGNITTSLFVPDKVRHIRMRLFNMSRGDDASNDFRGAFLKFGDQEEAGPLDLAFMTGRASCFSSVGSLQAFLSALDGDEDAIRDWAMTNQDNYYSLVDGIRRFPKCRTELDYYNHGTFNVTTPEGQRLVRFRLHGSDDVTSRLNKQEQDEAWAVRRPDMELPADTYLRDELSRIATRNKSMTLQVQVRKLEGDNLLACDPRQPWPEEEYPWQDLADLTLTYYVPNVAEDRASYNFTKLPDDIQYETPVATDNFGGLIQIQEKVLTSTVRKKYPEGTSKDPERTTTYLVHVETGNHLFSGTDAGVYIALYGTKGRTKKYLLDKLFHDDFERGSKESYYIDVPVIGDVKFIQIFLIGGKYTFMRSWFLSNIVLMDLKTRKLFEIPCYRWIVDNIILPTGEAVLMQNETHMDRRYLRQIYLDDTQDAFKWKHKPGLPGYIDCDNYNELPVRLKYSTERQLEKKKLLVDVMLKLKLHKYTTVFNSFDSFDDFKSMAEVIPHSETLRAVLENDRWRTDEEFGREFLDGVNPVLIRRLAKPVEKFPVTHDMVANLLDRGKTLEEEMQDGHIYYIDYKHLSGIQRKAGDQNRYVANALVMFYVRQSGVLVPIAIQLGQTPGPDTPIWTPNDAELDWTLAKMHVKSADSHYQTIWCHLTRAHFLMEVFTLSMYRQLPTNHPLYKLLIQHTRFTVSGAQVGRDLLLYGEDSIFQKILSIPGKEPDFISNCFADFSVDSLVPPKDFAARGVGDEKLLPGYHFRDDSLLFWDKIVEHVKQILSLFYKSDNDVIADSEVQAFVKDIREQGLKKMSAGDTPNGIPSSLKTLEQLVELAAMILFNSSVFHAAMNFSQLDYFAFAPNYPSAMRQPPPTEKGVVTEKFIMDTLPNKADQAVAIAFAYYLSEPLSDEVYIGDFVDCQFTETRVREIMDWFTDEMEKISQTIHKRNLDLDLPYIYLLPETVPKAAGQ